MSGTNEVEMGILYIRTTLLADSQLATYAPGGVHRGAAPAGTAGSYVSFNHQAGTDITSATKKRLYSDYLYQIKAVGKADDDENIFNASARIDALFGEPPEHPITVTGGIILSFYRESPVQYDENLPNGQKIAHSGGLFRLDIQAT